MPQGPGAGSNTPGQWWPLVFLGEHPRGIPFLFIYKKEKWNLIIGMSKGKWVHQTLL